MAMECSKWAASEPSAVTTVQSSGSIRVSQPPSVNIGSMARHRPGLELAPGTAGPVVRDLRLLVHLGADAVPDELADDAEAGRLGDGLDRGRDVVDVVARDGRRDPRHHRLAGQVDQLATPGGGSPT